MSKKLQAQIAFRYWVQRIGSGEARRRLTVKKKMEKPLRLCMQWCYDGQLKENNNRIVRDYDNLVPLEVPMSQAFDWLGSMGHVPGPGERARAATTKRIKEVGSI